MFQIVIYIFRFLSSYMPNAHFGVIDHETRFNRLSRIISKDWYDK